MEPLVRLPLRLPKRGSRQLLATLHAQLRAAILDGRLKPGMRLPSTRALATTYGVSRNTALATFDLLVSEGYVVTRRGSGTRVAQGLATQTQTRKSPGRSAKKRAKCLNPFWREAHRPTPVSLEAAARLRFRVGVPDLDLFPYDTWRRLSSRALREFQRSKGLGENSQGYRPLRSAIAQHVSFARAVSCEADDIVVTAGAQQAFDLLARVLLTERRSRIAVENPGYPSLRKAFETQGARIAPVPVDAEGIVVHRIPQDAAAVCVSPSHQFPLGMVMSAGRRLELLEHCARQGTVIIEDDYDGEFRFGERPLDALQTLDGAQSVFYVGTFSKSLLPALRLGYIVAPAWALGSLVAAKAVVDGGCNPVTQATLALMIREGLLAQHVRKMQRIYARRRQLLLDALAGELSPWLDPIPSIAGLHLAARLKRSADEGSFTAGLRRAALEVSTFRPYYIGPPKEHGVLLGYGASSEQGIVTALRELRQAL